ncbi:MAG: hypothetical protein FJ125_14280, partial [Deltaproteobacteria bacterium]|nr:hypothetical protein [Deltaproteobacteria bacterium]
MAEPTRDPHPPEPEARPRSSPALPAERDVLRAMLRSGKVVEEGSGHVIAWRSMAFDAGSLAGELLRLVPGAEQDVELGGRLSALAVELADRYRLQVARVDDLHLSLASREMKVPRVLVGEALGPLGADLFPTRRRARRLSTEAARELAYFGYGRMAEQVLPSPIELLRWAISGQPPEEVEPVLLEEDGAAGRQLWKVFDLLSQDRYFHRRVGGRSELARLQQRLREDPLDGAMVTRLRGFFSRRLTIGVRDTLRWTLGSRHPWFAWQRARELLDDCFERYGAESFLSPRRSFYIWDVELPDERLAEMLEQNRVAVELLADRLSASLPLQLGLGREALTRLAAAALDYHCDHPDFDVEATGRQQGETTARFLGRAAFGLAKNLAGWELQPRRNVNFAAHFEALGIADAWLGHLDARQKAHLYQVLRRQIRHFVAQSRGRDGRGRTPGYHRPPFALYTFFEAPTPRARPGERVLDSFRLSELRLPRNTHHLRHHPEIVGKLVVFFTLVLRHYLDTDHVPDLRPEKLVRDFMLLGIWG